MNQHQYICPFCSSPLLCHIRSGEIYWFCRNCYQEVPYGFYKEIPLKEDENGKTAFPRKNVREQKTLKKNLLNTILPKSLNIKENLHKTLTEIRQSIEADRVMIWQFGNQGEALITAESLGFKQKSMHNCQINQFLSAQEMEEFKHGKILVVEDNNHQKTEKKTIDILERCFQVQAKLIAPIQINTPEEKLWGLLVAHQCSHSRQWKKSEIGLFSLLAKQIAREIEQNLLYKELNSIKEELEQFATEDYLTQLSTRAHFESIYNKEWRRMAREKQPLSLIMADIDYFKQFNDSYGHQAGDECLEQIGKIISNTIRRPGDVAARYGGEEFIIILPNTNIRGAVYLAEQINGQVKRLQIPHNSPISPYVTISLGVASIIPEQKLNPDVLIKAADEALYQAKTQGRDRVISQQKFWENSVKSSLTVTQTPLKPEEVTNQELLMSYVAYFVSRGINIISNISGIISFKGIVYQYQGYHQEFIYFWHKLQQRHDFLELYLQGDISSFGQFLSGKLNVGECARCNLPIPVSTGAAYNIPNCVLCEDKLSDHNQTIIVIGQPPANLFSLQRLLSLNHCAISFISSPADLNSPLLSEPIDLILIKEAQENLAKLWAKQLHENPRLKQVPIIALSKDAGNGLPWLEKSLDIQDYLLSPVNMNLIHHLSQIGQEKSMLELHWFPC